MQVTPLHNSYKEIKYGILKGGEQPWANLAMTTTLLTCFCGCPEESRGPCAKSKKSGVTVVVSRFNANETYAIPPMYWITGFVEKLNWDRVWLTILPSVTRYQSETLAASAEPIMANTAEAFSITGLAANPSPAHDFVCSWAMNAMSKVFVKLLWRDCQASYT